MFKCYEENCFSIAYWCKLTHTIYWQGEIATPIGKLNEQLNCKNDLPSIIAKLQSETELLNCKKERNTQRASLFKAYIIFQEEGDGIV